MDSSPLPAFLYLVHTHVPSPAHAPTSPQGNHIFTSGATGTNAAVIRGALRAEKPELLTVVLPQSMSKQPAESQELLQQVGALVVVWLCGWATQCGVWCAGPASEPCLGGCQRWLSTHQLCTACLAHPSERSCWRQHSAHLQHLTASLHLPTLLPPSG